MNTTQTVLVIGGAGYIGSAVVQALCDEGNKVIVFDNLSRGDKKYVDERATFVHGDILDTEALERTFREHPPEVVVHLVALKAVGESEEEPERYFDTNVVGTLNVLKAASAHNVAHVIFSSSAAVYEPTERGVYDESSHCKSASVYGTTKVINEQMISDFARTGRIGGCTIFRYFNLAGDVGLGFVDPDPKNLFPLIAKAIAAERPIKIFGDDYPTPDGTCIRDYFHVADVVSAHLYALEKGPVGIVNLGSGTGYSVREIINAFSDVLGRDVAYEVVARRPGDPPIGIADPTKARDMLDWKAEKTIHDMVQSTLDVYGKQ